MKSLLLVLNWSSLAYQVTKLLRLSMTFVGNWASSLAKRMILGWLVAQGWRLLGWLFQQGSQDICCFYHDGAPGHQLCELKSLVWGSSWSDCLSGVTHIDQAHKAESWWTDTEDCYCEEVSGNWIVWPECSLSREGTMVSQLASGEVVCQVRKLKKDISGRDRSTWKAQRYERMSPVWKATVIPVLSVGEGPGWASRKGNRGR